MTIRARILKAIRPFTLPCVLQVVLLPLNEVASDTAEGNPPFLLEQPFILELFDRRFAPDIREQRKIASWTPEREEALVSFIWSGQLEHFRSTCEEWSFVNRKDLDEAQEEAAIAHTFHRIHESEVSAYELLRELQGRQVPIMYADVRLELVEAPSGRLDLRTGEEDDDFLDINGVLLEHIPGFLLEDLETQAPEWAWPAVCEQAIHGINKISDCGILNTDVRPKNVIVRPKHSTEARGGDQGDERVGYDVIIIDFALCDFRKNWGTDEEWRAAKQTQDEEGAIGYVMEGKLRRFKKGRKRKWRGPLPWEYKPSTRYWGQNGGGGEAMALGKGVQEEWEGGDGAVSGLDVVAHYDEDMEPQKTYESLSFTRI